MPENEDLDFSAFFKTAVAGEEAPAAEEPAAEPAPEPVATEPATEPAPVVEAVAEPAPAPAAEPVDVTKLISDTVAATAAALKPAEPAAAEPAAPAEPVLDPKFAKYREEWPEHAEVLDLALASQRSAMMAEFTKLIEPLKGQMTPMQEVLEAQAAQAHEATIRATHPDAFDLAPEIEKWIAAKPAYLQPAYRNVLEGGAATDVVAMVSEFKKETGKVAAPAAPTPDPEKAQRIQSAAPVAATRAATPGVVDPNDFEGAFRAASLEAQKLAV